jgi:hypothetical protein
MGVSIVIPTFKDDEALALLLKYLDGLPIDEIIIADAENRTNLPPSLQCFSATFIASQKGRGTQIAAGIKASTHPLIWVLHADSIPPELGPERIEAEFKDPKLALLTFTLGFDKPSFWLSLFAWFARWDSALSTFGDQGFAFRKTDFENLALDLNAYPLMEDVALRRAFKRRGKIKRSALHIISSARRFAKHGVLRTQMMNIRLLLRFTLGASPAALYKEYYTPSAFEE